LWLKSNKRVVFVGKYLLLGWLFDILIPRTTINTSLSCPKISNISIGKLLDSHFHSSSSKYLKGDMNKIIFLGSFGDSIFESINVRYNLLK